MSYAGPIEIDVTATDDVGFIPERYDGPGVHPA